MLAEDVIEMGIRFVAEMGSDFVDGKVAMKEIVVGDVHLDHSQIGDEGHAHITFEEVSEARMRIIDAGKDVVYSPIGVLGALHLR